MTFRIVLLGLITWLSYMGIFAKRGWLDYRRMKQRNAQALKKIEATEKQLLTVKSQIASFKTDKKAQERTIRKILGYVRANETVIEFD